MKSWYRNKGPDYVYHLEHTFPSLQLMTIKEIKYFSVSWLEINSNVCVCIVLYLAIRIILQTKVDIPKVYFCLPGL